MRHECNRDAVGERERERERESERREEGRDGMG